MCPASLTPRGGESAQNPSCNDGEKNSIILVKSQSVTKHVQHVVNTVDVNTLKIIKEMIQRKNPIIQERRVNQATNQAENTVRTKKPKILKKMLSEKHDLPVRQEHRETREAAH